MKEDKIDEIEKKLKETKELLGRFKKDIGRIEKIKDEVKLSAAKNKKYVIELKKALKKLLNYKYNNSNNVNKEEASNFLEDLYFWIDILDDETIYEYLPLFDKVTFNNIEEERSIFENIDLPIYINKLTGDVVIVKNKENNVTLYSSISNDDIEVAFDYFENNYISLKTFVEKGKYVGDKVVKFKNHEGESLDINFPYQDFIYYYDNLILAFEHSEEGKDSFYFYPEANLEVTSSVDLRFEGIKADPVAGLFKNKEYTYKTIMDNLKRKLKKNKEVSNSKKR